MDGTGWHCPAAAGRVWRFRLAASRTHPALNSWILLRGHMPSLCSVWNLLARPAAERRLVTSVGWGLVWHVRASLHSAEIGVRAADAGAMRAYLWPAGCVQRAACAPREREAMFRPRLDPKIFRFYVL